VKKRLALIALTILAGAAPLQAQEPEATPQESAYRDKRQQLIKELEQTQKQLSDIRGQRVQLQTRMEGVIATMMEERAKTLLLSKEANALQQLDAILTTAQDNLLDQRDRFLALGDAVRRKAGSVIVVLLRADSSSQQAVSAAALNIDNASVATRTYTETANSALAMGAVDQLYRANVLPTTHALVLQVTVNGQPVTQTVTVSATSESVTYVQFAVRNGQLTQTTWTSKGTTPF
jgi:hypothetical protein